MKRKLSGNVVDVPKVPKVVSKRKIEAVINPKRITTLYTSNPIQKGPVLYWMSREQRSRDNWSLLHAQQLALQNDQPVAVAFNFVPTFLGSTKRIHSFMIEGLKHVEKNLKENGIPFFLLFGEPEQTVTDFIKLHKVSHLVCDFSPLRVPKKWKDNLIVKFKAEKINCQIIEVDAHNVVPVKEASNKQEYSAKTIRKKITDQYSTYLTQYPELKKQIVNKKSSLFTGFDKEKDWAQADEVMNKQQDAGNMITWIKPGEDAALEMMNSFIADKLIAYEADRNDPNKRAVSNMSPYLHFGHISPQRLATEVEAHSNLKNKASVDSYLEELIVRRELAENFCHYNKNYDSVSGFPEWAQISLKLHKADKRVHNYTKEQLEKSQTYDPLWNAAQIEMVVTGKMHGYMRMYWAKKILEWTKSPEEALEFAIYLNDRFHLDGRDPNGYVGCAWSIGGVHDQGWAERPVFGKVRYMNDSGCKKKFKVDEYIKYCQDLLKEANKGADGEKDTGEISKKYKQRKITDSMSTVTKK
jgi:deoxyribodipyrimidine photo-lyase